MLFFQTEESKAASKSSKKKKNKGRQSSSSPLPQTSSTSSIASVSSNGVPSSGVKNKKKEDRKCSELKIGALQEDSVPSSPTSLGPPPGFSQPSLRVQSPVSPPPGFSVTLNSVARPVNGLTFTNSCGESFPISQVTIVTFFNHFTQFTFVQQYKYLSIFCLQTAGQFIQPTNSKERNSSLVQRIQSLQRDSEGFGKFCQMSTKFRRGEIEAIEYYNHCRESVGDRQFANVFPEILVLLPDIRKQQVG